MDWVERCRERLLVMLKSGSGRPSGNELNEPAVWVVNQSECQTVQRLDSCDSHRMVHAFVPSCQDRLGASIHAYQTHYTVRTIP